ncbi:MAG: hypothetical protein JWM77_129 [Rhodospirillales bacterium]|jgi:hypothetical protein|nr:hypothetical protein [Rhodospirillales bacterium]
MSVLLRLALLAILFSGPMLLGVLALVESLLDRDGEAASRAKAKHAAKAR